MITVLIIHVKMAALVLAEQITSLVPVLQNTREHCVRHVIFVTVKPAAAMVIARMENSIILVIVTVVILEQTVKMLTIALTRIVLTKAHVLSNTTGTNVYVIRDTQVLTASILTVTITDANMVPLVSIDTLTTRVHVHQDL